MGTVLLYNLSEPQKRMGVLMLLTRLRLRWREVGPVEQALSLGALLGLPGYDAASTVADASAADGHIAPFSDEMLVMHELNPQQFNALLQGLRRGKTPIALKAVITPHNVAWSSTQLHRELEAERRALGGGR